MIPAQRGERGERRSGQRAGPLAARAWHAVAISGPFVCCEKVQKDQINYARKNFSDAKESQASATSHDSRPAPQRPATLLNLLLLRPWRRAKLLHTPTASIPLLALLNPRLNILLNPLLNLLLSPFLNPPLNPQ